MLRARKRQRSIRSILHQRVLKEIGCLRRAALSEQQTRGDDTVESRAYIRFRSIRDRRKQRVREFSPNHRPICATSSAGPSRSSRAISEACKLAGTARAGDGIAAAVCRASPSLPASSTAFVISSTNNGIPSVRSTISAVKPHSGAPKARA
jgi:hypothetical protein